MKSIYYLCWRTWREAETLTPWSWYPMSRGSQYRKRTGSVSTLRVDSEMIALAYENRNAELLEEIEKNFIEDVCLSAFIEAESEEAAQAEVCRYFADAEFEKCQRVDEATKQKILELFGAALMKKAGS